MILATASLLARPLTCKSPTYRCEILETMPEGQIQKLHERKRAKTKFQTFWFWEFPFHSNPWFFIAMAFNIDHRVHHHWVQYIQQQGFCNDQPILTNSDEPQHLAGEAQQPQTLRSPILPSQQEQDTHSLTHQPYPSFANTKGRGGQHRRQQQQKENISIIQLDYTFMHDPHQAPQRTGKPHTYTILTAIESTTGIGLAVLTSKKGYTPHQASQLHRWIIKHGFTKSVLPSDHETSLMQLVSTIATGLKLPTRVSPLYSHQSQGKVERFHRNLFDQLRTT